MEFKLTFPDRTYSNMRGNGAYRKIECIVADIFSATDDFGFRGWEYNINFHPKDQDPDSVSPLMLNLTDEDMERYIDFLINVQEKNRQKKEKQASLAAFTAAAETTLKEEKQKDATSEKQTDRPRPKKVSQIDGPMSKESLFRIAARNTERQFNQQQMFDKERVS